MESEARVTNARRVVVVMALTVLCVAACPLSKNEDEKSCKEVANAAAQCISNLDIEKETDACNKLECKGEQAFRTCVIELKCGEQYKEDVAACFQKFCGTSDGGSGDGGSGSACKAAPTTNGCTDSNYPSECGDACGPADCAFACVDLNKCYDTQAEAEADCGTSCQACNTDGGGDGGSGAACHAAPTTNACTTEPNYSSDCGSTDGTRHCGSTGCAFACVDLNKCYGTQAEAEANCGTSCQACNTGGGNGGGG
jgi:hypothetical protein